MRRRICMIVPGCSANESDWCIPVVRNIMAGLAGRHDLVVYTPHYPFRRSTYTLFGATVHCLSDRKEHGVRRLLLWRELLERVRRDHAAAPFSLVHSFWATETGFLGARAARRIGVPLVVTIGGGELACYPRENYGAQLSVVQRTFVRTSFRCAAAITAGSAWVAGRVPAEFQPRVHRLPLGVDTEMFVPMPIRGGARLLVVSSMIPLKDHNTVLHAFAEVRRVRADATLEMTGEGFERERIEASVRALGLAGCVRFLGEVPHDRMPALYRDADRLLHASLYESQGMAILEALATGLPVIASDVGVAAELPSDLVHRFDPGNADAMAAAILRSLADGTHARACAEGGPEAVARGYSLAGMFDSFDRLYNQVAR
ncbi:MAG: glycosyltransferase family 4 protein [Bacteroidetes bacterium]|nr:glycosyltransferase family 4 protein [Bacteroidota bacterium]